LRVWILAASAAVVAAVPQLREEKSIDGRVVQVALPPQDVTLMFIEAREVFTVRLETPSASVEGRKLYIGDGDVAVDLVATHQGLSLQGVACRQGDQFKKGSTIQVRAGYKKPAELKPGDVYVVLTAVFFKLPAE
jgi:hypothetical protein